MPCSYEESAEEIAAGQKAAKRKLIQPYKKELDKVTRLLCSVMTALDEAQEDENCTTSEDVFNIIGNMPSVQVWWKEHKKCDKIRMEKEEKNRVLSKLSEREKKILGLTK